MDVFGHAENFVVEDLFTLWCSHFEFQGDIVPLQIANRSLTHEWRDPDCEELSKLFLNFTATFSLTTVKLVYVSAFLIYGSSDLMCIALTRREDAILKKRRLGTTEVNYGKGAEEQEQLGFP
jgi:hypothetical protein